MVLREMRGSAHLAAITPLGLPTSIAHAIKRPEDVELFGWGDEPPIVTDAAELLHGRAEELTNDALAGAVRHAHRRAGDGADRRHRRHAYCHLAL